VTVRIDSVTGGAKKNDLNQQLGNEIVVELFNVGGDIEGTTKKRQQNPNVNMKKKIPVARPRIGRGMRS
jgi:hypothetical protein